MYYMNESINESINEKTNPPGLVFLLVGTRRAPGGHLAVRRNASRRCFVVGALWGCE